MMATVNDKAVLDSIFNPLMPLGECLFDEDDVEGPEVAEPETEENVKSAEFERDGVLAAEAGDLDLALELLTRAVTAAPRRASPFNNRAQVHRLKGDTTAALVDLNNALNLSCGNGKAAAQAYCQRACIYLRDLKPQEAKIDFQTAAKLGSKFARAQLAMMNPYAAMCNKMLKDLMQEMKEEETEGEKV